jgi:glycine cleavage system H lipoate-binding protein
MFPWVDGFHWSVGHIVFLSLFFAVVLTILSTLLSAVWRTASDFRTHRATDMCWRMNFAELPETERRCRHQLAGRVLSRICDNAFDCRHCLKYAEFAGLRVHPESDGTLTVGLDELAHHLIGRPDSVELPEKGSEIESNGVAWRMKKNGHEIRVHAPIDGTVVSTAGDEEGWYLKIRPRQPLDLRHLLREGEVPGWLSSELDRLQLQLSASKAQPCLADGGTLMPELMDAIPAADWDTVLEATFLES